MNTLEMACSKTWSDLVWSGLVWSGLIWLVSLYWSGLVWSGIYGLFHWSCLYFSLFHYFFFIINIINHNVTYWCCLFYNSHSDDWYQHFLYSIYDLTLYIYTIVSITK